MNDPVLPPAVTIPIVESCDFCREFGDRHSSTFSKIYGVTLKSRVLAEHDGLVAIPTIGPLFPGHVLVLPLAHIETIASCPPIMLAAIADLAMSMADAVSGAGPFAIFEHGATIATGGGCGVYHAHLHIVPIPREVTADEVLPSDAPAATNLLETLESLRGSTQYLLFGTAKGYRYMDLMACDRVFPSQYLRHRLIALLDPGRAWDWRNVNKPEADLLNTVARFQVTNRPDNSSPIARR